MQHSIIYSITAGSIFLLSLVALTTPGKVNVRANRWLGFFLFALGCAILDLAFFDAHVYDTYPDLKGLLEVTRFAMTPALYFSVMYFTTPGRKFRNTDYLHFLPFFLFFLFILTVIFHVNDSPMFAWYYNLPEGVRKGVAITVFSSLKIQMVIYWILSYVQLVRHRRNIRIFASTLAPISLNWLKYFLLGLVVLLVLSLNDTLILIPAITPFTHYAYLILIFYIGYYSLRQQEIYPYKNQDVVELRYLMEPVPQATRHERISTEELAAAKQRLQQMMDSEKVYLNPELSLPQLATQLNMSTHDLSFVINEGFQENFFQFINRYRIEEAKILLRSAKHKHLSILGIAFEAGFRSKTTFNTTFKKLTGQSPSKFMEAFESGLHSNVA